MSDAYETDFYAWAMEQAALLRAGKVIAADIANIAEEIESLGWGEKRELVNRLTILLLQSHEVAFSAGLPKPKLKFEHPRAADKATQSFEGQSEPQGQAR